jgi:acyl carrier protein
MQTELSREQVRATVLSAFQEAVGVPPPHGLDTAPGDVPDWSSLAQVRLVHAVERGLGCVLDERLLTVGSTLAELVDAACVAMGIRDGM